MFLGIYFSKLVKMPISPQNFELPEEKNERIILATASYDHDIKLWQGHTGVCERTLQHPETVSNLINF